MPWWQRWRELHIECVSGVVDRLAEAVAGDGLVGHPPLLVRGLIRGSLTELSLAIASSDHHQRALTDALIIVDRLVDSLRIDRSPDPGYAMVAPAPRLRIGVGQLRASASSYLDRRRRQPHRDSSTWNRRGRVGAAEWVLIAVSVAPCR
jgi:hypothetical protein